MNSFTWVFSTNQIVSNSIRFSPSPHNIRRMGTGESNDADSENQRYSAPPPSPRFSVLSSFGFIKRSSHRRVGRKTSDMPSHRAGFAPSTTGFLTLHLSQGLPPKIAVPTFVPVSRLGDATRDHATRGSVNDRASSPVRVFFFERRPARLARERHRARPSRVRCSAGSSAVARRRRSAEPPRSGARRETAR